ncbi:hypothetical protein [uncultured Enorma sp.]|uniref:hypothetical protein n=1 Tax=uncultured Enorma sp. TaxID=1714346 RepID=UPI002660139B|nr:hypothetical protein [uncultured Enorma sp.]
MSGESLAGGFEAAAVAEPIAALLAFTVVAVLFVIVKWYIPHRAGIQEKKLEIERYRIEVQEKADAALDDRERERIKTTQRQIAAQEEGTRAIEALNVTVNTAVVQLADSKEKSREMGGRVERTEATTQRIDTTTSTMAKQLDEVHAIVVRRKGAGDEG